MNIMLLTEHDLKFLSLTRGYTCLSESTLVKMPHCWKSYVAAQLFSFQTDICPIRIKRIEKNNLYDNALLIKCSPQYC